MKLCFHSRNSVAVETAPGEHLFLARRFLLDGPANVRPRPAFWKQCVLGRLLHDCYWLRDVGGAAAPATAALTGPHPTGVFEALTLGPGEKAFVALEYLAGFVVPESRLRDPHPPVMRPVFRGLLRPTFWVFGHPVPCVFEGPVTVLFHGAALRWDDSLGRKAYQPRQVVSFDATRPFGVLAMQPGTTLLSLVYNALTFESRFVAHECRLLVEDYLAPPRVNLGILKHFLAHAVFALLLALLLWLNR